MEAAGEGLESGRHSAPLTTGARGVLHGAMSAVLQDEHGQVLEAHSVSAGLDYPGVGPRARLAARRGPGALRGGARRRRAGGLSPARASWRGSSPRSSPRTRSRGCWPTRPTGSTCWSCRAAATRTSPRCSADERSAAAAAERIAAAFAGHGKPGRADALPDGRPPGRRRPRSRRAEAAAEAGADLIELGVPFSDPLADGPVIHAAATEALAAGVTPDDVLGRVRGGVRARCRSS